MDIYDINHYKEYKLQLYHEPPFRLTHHTIYEESYLLSGNNHQELHYPKTHNHEEYDKRMDRIKENKKIWEKNRFRFKQFQRIKLNLEYFTN